MAKPKTLEQLRAEKERAETQLAQEQHNLQRLENRKQYYEKGAPTVFAVAARFPCHAARSVSQLIIQPKMQKGDHFMGVPDKKTFQ